ncbi:MAG: hypothetical protein K2N65_00830, partial [Anaeroplasmataceae bacterium]|nr:hypothetical protein [Anaeroplasmataceae bacterium]
MKKLKICTIIITIFLICGIFSSCAKKQSDTGHVHSKVHVPEKSATCLEEGLIEHWYCSHCGKIFRDRDETIEITEEETILPITNHTSVEDEAIAATCEESGITQGYHCSVCGKVLLEQQSIDPLQHDYDYEHPQWEWTGFTAANCIITCKNDRTHQIVFPATISSQTINASCTNSGKVIYTASVEIENELFQDVKEDILLPTDHSFDLENMNWIWEEETANVQIPCKNDKTHILNYNAPTQVSIVPPTCLEAGKKTIVASISIQGQKYEDAKEISIPAIGHAYDYDHIEWNWTGFEAVTAIIPCLNDNSHPLQLPATVTSHTTPATCVSVGNTTYKAQIEVDGHTYTNQKIEEIPLADHDINYEEYEWVWEGFESATLIFGCKNDASHKISYVGEIEETITPSTCVVEGKKEYLATVSLQGKTYESKKEQTLPINPTAHDYNYEELEFHWKETFDSYQVVVEVPCKCLKESLYFYDASIDVENKPNTFQEAGYIKYTASIELLDNLYQDELQIVLPMKQAISTEEEFLNAIQSPSYHLVFMADIAVESDIILNGAFNSIDLNTHSLTLLNDSLVIESKKSSISNGRIQTGNREEFALVTNHASNVILNAVEIFGGLQATASTVLIESSSFTSAGSFVVSAYESSEIYIEDTILYQNTGDAFFYIDDINAYTFSEITLVSNVSLYTTRNAKLYDAGIAPIIKASITLQNLSVDSYLGLDMEYKYLVLTKDFVCEKPMRIIGKEVYL